MLVFLWAVAILFGTVSASLIVCLAHGRMPQRTPITAACDLVINIAFFIWAIDLLRGSA